MSINTNEPEIVFHDDISLSLFLEPEYQGQRSLLDFFFFISKQKTVSGAWTSLEIHQALLSLCVCVCVRSISGGRNSAHIDLIIEFIYEEMKQQM